MISKVHVRRIDWFALAFFAALACVLAGPSLFDKGRNVCANWTPDTWVHIWAFWRAKYAMGGLDQSYVMSSVVTYPGHVLELSAVFDPLLPWLSLPLQCICTYSSTVFNLLVAIGITFTGFSGYLLTSFLSRRRPAGLVGGVIIALNPFLYRQALGGYTEYMWCGLISLAVWFFLRSVRFGRLRTMAGYVVTFLSLFLMSIYCAACYAVLAVLWTAREALRAISGRANRLARALRIHLVSALCLLPVILFWVYNLSALQFRGLPLARDFPIAALQEVQARAVAGKVDEPLPIELWVPWRTIVGSIDIADLLGPGNRWARSRERELPRRNDRLAPVTIMGKDSYERVFGGEWILVLGLVALAWMSRRRRVNNAEWLLLAAFFLAFGLGPYAVWKGIAYTDFSLPYAWAYKWFPGFSRLMIPARAFLVSTLCIAVVAARGSDFLARRVGARVRFVSALPAHTAMAVILFLFFAWTGFKGISLPSVSAEVPALYEKIGLEPGCFALLELPPGHNVDFRMYCQSVHGRPIYKGVVPNGMVEEHGTEVVDNDPLVRALNQADPGRLDSAMVVSSGRFLAGLGFRYLLLHDDGYPDRAIYESTCSQIEQALGPPSMTDPNIKAWRLNALDEKHE